MNLGLRAHDLKARDIVSIAENLKEIEVENIQLALLKSIENIDFKYGSFSPGLAEYIKKELDRCDVHITVLGCYINPVHPDPTERGIQLRRFTEQLKYAKFLGADMVGTETGSVNANFSFNPENHGEAAYLELVESMKGLVAQAEKLGVMIGIEAVATHVLNSPERMKRFLDDIASPNVMAIFDPVNLITAENYTEQHSVIEKAIELYGDKMGTVHLKDFKVENGIKYTVKPGDGLLDFDFLFKKLKEAKPYIAYLMEEIPFEFILESFQYLKTAYHLA